MHALDEVGSDFENAHLNQLVGIGLVAERAVLLHFVRVDALHTEADELFRVMPATVSAPMMR